MKKASRTSPFEGQTQEDIHHRWLLWKLESDPPTKQTEKQTDGRYDARGNPDGFPTAHQDIPAQPTFQHRRYDAVIRRMQNATRQTGTFTSVP